MAVASHDSKHHNFLAVDRDACVDELVKSKDKIKEKIGIDIDIFVYPYGKFNQDIFNLTKKYYLYQFSIGRLINLNVKTSIIYRVYADDMIDAKKVLSPKKILAYILFYILLMVFPRIKK